MTDDITTQGGGWVSSGKKRGTEDIIFRLALGDQTGRTMFQQGSLSLASQQIIQLAGGYEWRFTSFKHSWFKDWDRHGTSKFHWSAIIIDSSGQQVMWDSVEVAARASPDPFGPAEIQQEYYHYLPGPTDTFGVDWDKEGADPDFHSAAKCFKGGQWIFWHFGSHAS